MRKSRLSANRCVLFAHAVDVVTMALSLLPISIFVLILYNADAAPILATNASANSAAPAKAVAATASSTRRSLKQERQAPQPQQQKPDPNWKPPDPMALATWKNSGHDSELHDETEIMPDDFLWQNLPGRCCFTGHWDNQRKDKAGGPLWVSIHDCSQCDVWGQPDATCHSGPTECMTYVAAHASHAHSPLTRLAQMCPCLRRYRAASLPPLSPSLPLSLSGQQPRTCRCGMELYCEGRPPPLLGGARTCTGASRIGEGCFDMLKMGVCMSRGLDECMQQCQTTPNCEMVVYYTQEMKGSCTLCAIKP